MHYNDGAIRSIPGHKLQMFEDIARASQLDHGWGQGHHSSKTFPYISLGLHSFVPTVVPHLKPNMRVVDVGCGAGDKLLAFHHLDPSLHITGIEHNDTMAACAEYTCPFATIIRGDALAQNYSQYDLIYMYSPLCDDDLQVALQARCMMQMRKGAVLIVIYKRFVDPMTGYRFPLLEQGWLKDW